MIEQIGIVGAGTMGNGIAQVCAAAGLSVTMTDISEAALAKGISVVTGRVFAAYVDLRKGDTFGKVVTVEIDPNVTVFLPQGVANSFQTLEDDTYYLYSVNAHWSADNYEKYSFVNLGDESLKVEWPISLDTAIVNDRDRNHPLLKDITPMEI